MNEFKLSKRLACVAGIINPGGVLADIGTDHGYVPLIALERGICNKAIACDINKDPLDKARLNAILEGIGDELEFRLGGGFEPLKVSEANEVVIAGMGGNLIRDILEADLEKVKSAEYLILVPAQNPEVLRAYLYKNNYEIIKEDLCLDEGIYYELFKVRSADSQSTELDSIYYEVSPILLRSKNPLMKQNKIDEYNRILGFITEETVSANNRRAEIQEKISIITGMLNYL